MVKKTQKFADPKDDPVFKKLFEREENKDLLIGFINSFLPNKHVVKVDYLPTLQTENIRMTQCMVDVICTDQNGSKYIVEIQNVKENYFGERNFFYDCNAYVNQLGENDSFFNLKETICISIVDFIMFPSHKICISTHNIRNEITNEIDLNELTFKYIELPKYKKKDAGQLTIIDEWCEFFKYADQCYEFSTSSPIIEKAYHVLEMNKWSEKEILEYQAYEKQEKINCDMKREPKS